MIPECFGIIILHGGNSAKRIVYRGSRLSVAAGGFGQVAIVCGIGIGSQALCSNLDPGLRPINVVRQAVADVPGRSKDNLFDLLDLDNNGRIISNLCQQIIHIRNIQRLKFNLFLCN